MHVDYTLPLGHSVVFWAVGAPSVCTSATVPSFRRQSSLHAQEPEEDTHTHCVYTVTTLECYKSRFPSISTCWTSSLNKLSNNGIHV